MIVGAGLGARATHMSELLELSEDDAPAWLELLADNHLHGPQDPMLDALAERYPIALHCVGMNLGGVDPLDDAYLERVRALANRLGAVHISDHLAVTALDGVRFHDLWPVPCDPVSADHIAARIARVQEILGQTILVENVSSYARYEEDTLEEAEVLEHISSSTGCGLILDVNNLWVNQHNHGVSAEAALSTVPLDRVGYIHLAGHTARGELLIDTHDHPVAPEVWALFSCVQHMRPGIPALLEWDDALPPLPTLLGEVYHARDLMQEAR